MIRRIQFINQRSQLIIDPVFIICCDAMAMLWKGLVLDAVFKTRQMQVYHTVKLDKMFD